MAVHLSPRPWATMTVEVCLLRAGTTSAALLDMIVDVVGVVVVVYQWEGSSFDVSDGMTLEGAAEAFHVGLPLIAREGATDKALQNITINRVSN